MSATKCHSCKINLKSGDIKEYGKNKYCSVCYDKAKKKESERRQLIGVICDIFNIDRPTGMMFAQMKQFEKEGIDYNTTRLTLQYLVAVEKFDLDVKFGIGIVRHRYMDMRHHYNQMLKKRREIQEVEYESSNYKVKLQDRENKIVKSKMIDLNSIIGGDSLE